MPPAGAAVFGGASRRIVHVRCLVLRTKRQFKERSYYFLRFLLSRYGKLKQAPKAPFKLDGDMHCVGDTSVRRALRETITTCLTSANYRDRRGIVCV